MANTKSFLQQIEMFIGLSDEMLDRVADLAQQETYKPDDIIIERNAPPVSFYLIQEGMVEINTGSEESSNETLTLTLGNGQSFGEMGLVDSGLRSATVKATITTILLVINCEEFLNLCDEDTRLGYNVMRNIAVDLSFKLRTRNLI